MSRAGNALVFNVVHTTSPRGDLSYSRRCVGVRYNNIITQDHKHNRFSRWTAAAAWELSKDNEAHADVHTRARTTDLRGAGSIAFFTSAAQFDFHVLFSPRILLLTRASPTPTRWYRALPVWTRYIFWWYKKTVVV